MFQKYFKNFDFLVNPEKGHKKWNHPKNVIKTVSSEKCIRNNINGHAATISAMHPKKGNKKWIHPKKCHHNSFIRKNIKIVKY